MRGHLTAGFLTVGLTVGLLAGLSLGGCAYVDGYSRQNTGLPRDVQGFIDRRSACAHYRTDDAFDNDGADFIAGQSAMYCTGTDAELTRLRRKYAARDDVTAALDALEADIEQGR